MFFWYFPRTASGPTEGKLSRFRGSICSRPRTWAGRDSGPRGLDSAASDSWRMRRGADHPPTSLKERCHCGIAEGKDYPTHKRGQLCSLGL